MPVLLGQLATIVGGTLMTMLGQLASAAFVKHVVVKGLEVVVKKTDTQEDDDILKAAKEAWNVK